MDFDGDLEGVGALPSVKEVFDGIAWREEMMEGVARRRRGSHERHAQLEQQERHEVLVVPVIEGDIASANPWCRYVDDTGRHWWAHDDGRALWEERVAPWQRYRDPSTLRVYWACPTIDDSSVTTPSFYES